MKVENEELLPIGRFSQLTGVTAKALRHYDDVGLLRPAHVDPWNGYRYYALEQARVAESILRLRGFQLPLDEIAAVLADPALMRERLAVHRARLEGQAVETNRILVELDRLIHGEETLVSNDALRYTIEELPELTLAAIRTDADFDDLPRLIPEQIGLTAEWAFANDRLPAAPVAVCPMVKDGRVDLKVGWPVSGTVEPPEPIELYTCPAGRAAVVVHRGDFPTLHNAWRRLYEALRADGIEPRGEGREHYETSPDEVSDPSEHVTRLVWPLET